MFVVEDTNFLISLLKSKDIFHMEAISTLEILSSGDITYIFPSVVLQEAIFVLLRNGYNANIIRKRIYEISMLPKVIIHSIDNLSMLRYSSHYYKRISVSGDVNTGSITGTNDFNIACVALDYNALIVSNDKRLIKVANTANIETINFILKSDREKLKKLLFNPTSYSQKCYP